MIKDLINDLAFDKINLSQALTRSKIIATKIGNGNFKSWLIKELEGYEPKSNDLPKYRKIWAPISLTAEFPFGHMQKFRVLMADGTKERFVDKINFHLVLEPISIIEQNIGSLDKPKGYIQIPQEMVQDLANMYKDQVEDQGGAVRSGSREVGRTQFQKIIELTKQSLLDTLLELDNEFPNLLNEYTMSKENNEKVQNIITNNIYGSDNAMNIAAGQNVTQTGNSIELNKTDVEKLKSFGIDDDQINELKVIIDESSDDKESFKGKSMKWLGNASASIAAKGLYEHIPQLTEFVQNLI